MSRLAEDRAAESLTGVCLSLIRDGRVPNEDVPLAMVPEPLRAYLDGRCRAEDIDWVELHCGPCSD